LIICAWCYNDTSVLKDREYVCADCFRPFHGLIDAYARSLDVTVAQLWDQATMSDWFDRTS
jgi:hypothetical protein